MTLRNWLVVGVCTSAMTLVGCVAPASKSCESDEDCFAGEMCGPGGQCIAKSDTDGETTDTGPSRDGADDTGSETGDAADAGDVGDTQGTETDDVTDGGPDGGGTTIPPTDFYYFTSGGGTGMSSSYDIQVRIGAPSPGFRGGSENYRLQLAPVRP